MPLHLVLLFFYSVGAKARASNAFIYTITIYFHLPILIGGLMDDVMEKKVKQIQEELGRAIACSALEFETIKLSVDEPFTWASGYKMPIYNDNRRFLAIPRLRNKIAQAFAELLKAVEFSPQYIAGTATAGIPHATTLADLLDLPLCYVRQSQKTHGLCNVIEGLPKINSFSGQNVLVIEDLISTGSSSINACKAVVDVQGKVPYCFAIFSYGMKKATEAFSLLDPPCISITIITYDIMLEEALKMKYINEEELELLKKWKASPFTWWEDRRKG